VPALFLNALKLIFLLLLFLFLWQVARSIRGHIGSGSGSKTMKTASTLVIVKSETLAGQRFAIGTPAVVGRSEDADIVLDDSYASDFHFRIGQQDGKIVLSDLGSTNGTYVNGRRVTVPTSLAKGDSVQIGKTIFEVR
jgi:pSer/pThr/pTyr-binding forkhead associated (FHA) protein